MAEEVSRWDVGELEYVLDEKASAIELEGKPKHFKGGVLARDAGHEGKTLVDFCAMASAKAAGLTKMEVMALRLATGRCGVVLDEAMRAPPP